MTESRQWFWLAVSAVVLVLLYILSPVLTPFIVAAVLAYIGDPWADRIETKLPRSVSVVIVFLIISLVMFAVILVLMPALQKQISFLSAKIPVYIDRIQMQLIPWLEQELALDLSVLGFDQLKQSLLQHWKQAGGLAISFFNTLSASGMALVAWVANLVLIPVLTFYLLRDWDILVERVHEMIPRRYEATIAGLAKESDEVLGAFLRGQVMVMLGLGIIYSVGLWLVGLDLSLLLGMLAGMVSFVPYLGFVVGIIAAGIAALLQFQEAWILVPVLIVFAVGQLAESFVLTPLLVGDKIGLHPVAVIFAVMAGGQLFGFFGILLALPVAAVVMVVLRHVHEKYKDSELYHQ